EPEQEVADVDLVGVERRAARSRNDAAAVLEGDEAPVRRHRRPVALAARIGHAHASRFLRAAGDVRAVRPTAIADVDVRERRRPLSVEIVAAGKGDEPTVARQRRKVARAPRAELTGGIDADRLDGVATDLHDEDVPPPVRLAGDDVGTIVREGDDLSVARDGGP